MGDQPAHPPPQQLTQQVTFDELGLDSRIRRALTRMRWARPTPVQRQCVLLALQGKDVLARAPTGSGKTAGYALPALHKLLKQRAAPTYSGGGIECVVLVPTVELCKQVVKVFKELARYCTGESAVRVLGLAADAAVETQQTQLAELWHIVVATPGRLATLLGNGSVALERSVHTLIIDEADLMLSYGYEEDTRQVVSAVPRICQSLLMSATLSDDVEELQKLVLHNPAVVDISDTEHGTASRLAQYYIRVPEKDKHLLLYTLLKLKVVPGKALIFVNDVEGCFKLKLFLDQFGIAAAALDSQLPHNSRLSIVEAFNKGIFDYLIATDESTVEVTEGAEGAAEQEQEQEQEQGQSEGFDDDDDVAGRKKRKKKQMQMQTKQNQKRKRSGGSADYNAARGLDFQRVSAVLNFDLPVSAQGHGDVAAYTHRIGRTARAGASGVALSLVAPSELSFVSMIQKAQDEKAQSEGVHAGGGADFDTASNRLSPLRFEMGQISGFRYRTEGVLAKLRPAVVREARVEGLRKELINSHKLQSHFEAKPSDLSALKLKHVHQAPLVAGQVDRSLRQVPGYMVPKSLLKNPNGVLGQAKKALSRNKGTAAGRGSKGSRGRGKGKGKYRDPLKNFGKRR